MLPSFFQSLIHPKRASWESEADVYRYNAGLGEYARNKDERIISHFLQETNGLVLDVPCGSGRFTKLLKERNPNVIAADYSMSMLKATEKIGGIQVIRCDAYHLPFRDNIFDNVLTVRLLFHYPDSWRIIQELARVCMKGGSIIFDTLNKYSLRYFLAFPIDFYRNNPGRRLWFSTRADVKEIIEKFGLELECTKSGYLLPTRAYRFLPKFLIYLLDKLESVLPNQMKVLSYWKVRKLDSFLLN